MAEEDTVRILPYHAQLTTKPAANFLHESSRHGVDVAERHELPCRKLSSRRQILLNDFVEFRSAWGSPKNGLSFQRDRMSPML